LQARQWRSSIFGDHFRILEMCPEYDRESRENAEIFGISDGDCRGLHLANQRHGLAGVSCFTASPSEKSEDEN
jgi:hypothetical protein